MDFKYSKVLKNELNPTADMLLFGDIGGKIDGDIFANELKFIFFSLGIKNIQILINTIGGSVIQGYSILAAMSLIEEKGGDITVKNVGVAYSMGGVILAAGKKRIAVDYSTGMIHDPKFTGIDESNLSESEKQLLQKTTDSITTILSNKTGIASESITQMMSKETFMSAKEMKSKGFIDEVENTGKSIKNGLNNIERMAACADIYNKKSIKKMDRLNAVLKLNAEASEEARIIAVNELIGKAEKFKEATNELELEKAKTVKFEGEVKDLKNEQNRAKAETLVDKAIEEAKIGKDSRDMWIEDAMADFERTEKKVKLLNAKPASIKDQLTSEDDLKLAKEYGELIDKNPELLDTIDPEKVKAMEAAYEKLGNKVNILKIS